MREVPIVSPLPSISSGVENRWFATRMTEIIRARIGSTAHCNPHTSRAAASSTGSARTGIKNVTAAHGKGQHCRGGNDAAHHAFLFFA